MSDPVPSASSFTLGPSVGEPSMNRPLPSAAPDRTLSDPIDETPLSSVRDPAMLPSNEDDSTPLGHDREHFQEAVSTEAAADFSEMIPTGVPYPAATGPILINPTSLIRSRSSAHADDAPLHSGQQSTRDLPSEDVLPGLQPAKVASSDGSVTLAPSTKGKFSFFARRKAKDEAAKKSKQKEAEASAIPAVGFTKLFRFATRFEIFMNIVGLLLAFASGAAQPLMTLIFGRLTSDFTAYGTQLQIILQNGETPEALAALQAAQADLKVQSGNNALYLLAIGVGIFVTTYAYMFIWNWTGEVISKRVREEYLRAVLRQEVSGLL